MMQYPHCRPSVVFLKWRGLADSHLSVIRQEVEDKISSLVGAEMLYDLISVSVPYNFVYVYCDNIVQ